MFLISSPSLANTPSPVGIGNVHTVVHGDTLYRIARVNNTCWHVLAMYNQIPNPRLIFPGQQIRIVRIKQEHEIENTLARWGCLPGVCRDEGCLNILRFSDFDKQNKNVSIYSFIVDFSHRFLSLGYHNAHAWVNSATGEIKFEEAGYSLITGRNYYANIPDSMFPIPMQNNIVIPYDQFNPPGHGWGISYVFSDITVMETYKEQLRNAGFAEYGRVMSIDWLWRHERECDGATLIVEMYLTEQFVMNMFVNFLDGHRTDFVPDNHLKKVLLVAHSISISCSVIGKWRSPW